MVSKLNSKLVQETVMDSTQGTVKALLRDVTAVRLLDPMRAFQRCQPTLGQSFHLSCLVCLSPCVFQGTFWLYSDRSIFQVIVRDEDRDVWRLYLDKALAVCDCRLPYTTVCR